MTNVSPGTLILGVFAVLFGLVGAYGAKQYLREEPKIVEVEVEQRLGVPMAATDLPAGRTLTFGDVVLLRLTDEQRENRGIASGFMTDPRQVIGRTLREPLKQGDTFFTTSLYSEGTGPSVAARLKPGYRAVSISLENRAADSSLVSPGSMVDVLFRTFAGKSSELPETTVTLLERVEVLAIGQEMLAGTRTPRDRRGRGQTVTLAVTPRQAGALGVVEGRGTLWLSLRAAEDDSVADAASPQTLETLLGFERPEAPFTTEYYRRGQLTTAVFEEGRQTATSVLPAGLPISTNTIPTPVEPTLVEPTLVVANSSAKDPCGCDGK